MDWRHMGELLDAGEQVFSELKNLCVWIKTNGGMGSFYRSRHELIFVFKVGTAQHVNTFGLGETGRYRTNVWEYAGVNSFRKGRLADLELHPTVKPVDLVADAIKDCSRRGAIVLDPFGGSGTTMVAAQKSGRLARLIEYDPAYCDVILRRFEAATGTSAILARTGQTFGCGRVHPARNFALSGLTDGSLTSTRKLTRAWSLLGESPATSRLPHGSTSISSAS
jgi:hypothetical protein